jgi:hypothetical protein
MPTGITSAWGYPINAVGGQIKTMLSGDHPLTYELGMTSYPPTFPGGIYQSPLTPVVNSSLSAFGKSKRISKKMCKLFLKNKSQNPLTGRKIKRSGNVFKKLIKDCEHHGLLKKKKL